MKKFLLSIFVLALCVCVFWACDTQTAPEPEEPGQTEQPKDSVDKELTFDEYEFCVGGEFYRVSDNGKYVVGASGLSFAAFVYLVEQDTIVCLNPEWEDASPNAHLVSATAMDVSDGGIIVGQYAFDDTYRRPAIYNINEGVWSELPLPEGTKNSITEVGSFYGEATCISADGKFISGYIISYMDKGESRRNVACVWQRTNNDEKAPEYKLQLPIDTEADKIHCNGDWVWHMSNDGRWLGGVSSAKNGSFNVGIWENKGEGSLLERTWLIGKEDWIRTEDDNGDGVVDDNDGGDTTICQYDWNGQVTSISPSGEWIVGYHNFNGTGIIPEEDATSIKSYPNVGFRYNTITKALEDSLQMLPTVVFDDASMICYEGGTSIINGASVDKKVQCGSCIVEVESLGMLNSPFVKITGN